MNDYISREAFIEQKRKLYCENCSRRKDSKGKTVYKIGDAPCRACGIGDVLDDLDDFPAADVRPVVRCRDCINYVESDEANGEKMCVRDADWSIEDGYYYGLTVYTQPDWFCAGGKKREES